MIIKKKLNNNAIITKNNQNQEIIVVGKGIGYGKDTNNLIDENKIYKIFVPENKGEKKRILDMISQIPVQYIEISGKIISYARRKYELILNESVYIALTDHISSSLDRYHEGIFLRNKFQWEIKHFYPNEFDIGLKGLEIIKEECGIELKEDEAGFIGMHIVSSEVGQSMDDFYVMTLFIQQMTNIVKYHFSIEFDEESLDYYRFITHLKFFWHRISRNRENTMGSLENEILEVIKNKRVNAYLCALKIKQFIEEKYKYELGNEEILYLTIHISRITKNIPEEE